METNKPITKYVKIFDYFKTYNIIEFKSVKDPFRIDTHVPKMLIYIGGILLNENNATLENTTFTILSARKPMKLIRRYKKYIQKVKNGIYLIERLVQVPVYVVVPNEVKGNLDREMALIKEFSTGNEQVRFIEEVLQEVLSGNLRLKEYLHFVFYLYRNEINTIMEKEGVSMSIGVKNIEAWNEQLGLKDKYKKEGIKEGIEEGIKEGKIIVAMKMIERGFSIPDIMDTTDLSREEIIKLLENSQ